MPKDEHFFLECFFQEKCEIYKSKIAKFHHMKIKKIHAIPWADFEIFFKNKIMQIKKSRYSAIIDGNISTNNYEIDKKYQFLKKAEWKNHIIVEQ